MPFQKCNWSADAYLSGTEQKSWALCIQQGSGERRKRRCTLLCPQQGWSSGDGAAGVVGGPAGIRILVYPWAELSLAGLLVCGAQHWRGAHDWCVTHTLLNLGVLQLARAGEKWLDVVLDGRLAAAAALIFQRDALKENIPTKHRYVTFWPTQ